MNRDFEFTLNTNIVRFEGWFERYRIKTLPFIVELDQGRALHVMGGPTLMQEYQGLRIHEIQAGISKPHPTEPETGIMSVRFPVVRIELFEPTDNRLNVKLICIHESMIPYTTEMSKEIAKLWPEAEKSRDKIVKKVVVKEGTRANKNIPAWRRGLRDTEFTLPVSAASYLDFLMKRVSDFQINQTSLALTTDIFPIEIVEWAVYPRPEEGEKWPILPSPDMFSDWLFCIHLRRFYRADSQNVTEHVPIYVFLLEDNRDTLAVTLVYMDWCQNLAMELRIESEKRFKTPQIQPTQRALSLTEIPADRNVFNAVLNHTSGGLQPGEYRVDERGALALQTANAANEAAIAAVQAGAQPIELASDRSRKTEPKNGDNDIPSEYQEEQKAIFRACVDWVYRPSGSSKSFQEFLDQRFEGYHIYSDKVFYKTHLPKATELGLIKKVGRFYRPVYKSRHEAYRKIDSILFSRE